MNFSAMQAIIFRTTTDKSPPKNFPAPVTDSGFSSLADVDSATESTPDSSIEAEELHGLECSQIAKEASVSSEDTGHYLSKTTAAGNISIADSATVKLKPLVNRQEECRKISTFEPSKNSNDVRKLYNQTITNLPECELTNKDFSRIQHNRSPRDDSKRQQHIKQLFLYWRTLKDKQRDDHRSSGFLAIKCQMKKFVDLQMKVNTVTKDNLLLEKQLGLVSKELRKVEVTVDSLAESFNSLIQKR